MTEARRAADEAADEAMNQAMDEAETGEQSTLIANRNFDPSEMEDIQILRINAVDGSENFKQLIKQGYVCYSVHMVRVSVSIYNYSHAFDAVMAKKKSE